MTFSRFSPGHKASIRTCFLGCGRKQISLFELVVDATNSSAYCYSLKIVQKVEVWKKDSTFRCRCECGNKFVSPKKGRGHASLAWMMYCRSDVRQWNCLIRPKQPWKQNSEFPFKMNQHSLSLFCFLFSAPVIEIKTLDTGRCFISSACCLSLLCTSPSVSSSLSVHG